MCVGGRFISTSQDDQHTSARCPQSGRDAGCRGSHCVASSNRHGFDFDAACLEGKAAPGEVKRLNIDFPSHCMESTMSQLHYSELQIVDMQVCAVAAH